MKRKVSKAIQPRKKKERPLGVLIIVILGMIAGGLLLFAGAIIFITGSADYWGPLNYFVTIFGSIIGIIGIFLIILHWFLWKMNKTAFIIRMIAGAFAFVVALASLTGFGIGVAIIHGIMLYYLYTKKDLFK
jgi:hypothetical protein